MKKKNLLLTLLLISASMLFAQQVELKTIASTSQFPDGILGDGVTLSDIKILDVLDNYLICKKPANAFKKQSDIFLLTKDLSAVKFLEVPEDAKLIPYHLCKVGNYYLSQVVKGNKQVSFAIYDRNLNYIRMVSLGKYSNYIPVYLGEVGGNHFVKLINGFKNFALATFDDQMNLIKVEPMENFGRLCCDSNYIYLQNIPLKAKRKDQRNGELLKMDKDMNIVLRKPVTDQSSRLQGLQIIDTLGYSILYNRGTYMTIDKETLEQTKLDLRSIGTTGLIYTDTVIYESDRLIRIVLRFNSLSISVCDYNGNELQNREIETYHHSQRECAFLEYRNNKVYVLLNKKKDIAIVSLDIETGAQDTISSFQLEQNPGYTHTFRPDNIDYDYNYYDVSADIWKYNDNSYNLILSTEKQNHIAHFTNDNYDGYLSYIHLDKNFQLLKLEEGTYPNVRTINRCSYKPIHHFGNYTLLLQYIPDKEITSDVQFVIWDKSGKRKVVPTNLKALFAPGGEYSTYNRGWPLYTPVIYKCSPNRYYILAGIYKSKYPTPLSLTELTIKP